MSKIFEALQKTEGEVADLARPLLTQTAGETPKTGGEDRQDAAVPGAHEGAEASPAIASTVEIPDTQEDVAAYPPAGGGRIRTVPIRLSADAPMLPFDDKHSRAGEQYRVARTKLLHHPRQPRMVVISSAGSGDGKTVTAINLAGALALKSEEQVLLVDADLRRSQIAGLLGISNSPGLADVLSGGCALEDAIVRLEQFPNFCVLPGGKPITNPTELLDSSRWATLCAAVRRQYRYVVFDTPPLATVADYDLIQAHCDGVVLVVRPDHTNRKLCLQAIEMVPKERLVGVLMNCVRDWFLWKTRDYYYAGN
ncbi:MAG TPA: CpsD/CapB family tyrosine-protein kinase [Bryobacteraceae bacterium]|nr:CpsD/CapB family tyrosine-protein kinase [Bryobacteraceae bacterium]